MKAKEVVDGLQKEAKRSKLEGTILTADQLHNPFDLRRPCGVPSVDLGTGGGLPAGGLSQIDGPPSIGKNFLLYQYMAKCQEFYKEKAAIAMACFEMIIDKDFARASGLQIAYDDYEIGVINRYRKNKGQPPINPEKAKKMKEQLGVFTILRGTSEKVMEQMIKLIASNTFQIIGVDCWDVILPKLEEDKELSEAARMAAQAGLQTKFMRKFHATMNRQVEGKENETTIIGINQVRAKMSTTSYGRKWTSVGAYAMKHGKLVNITLSPGKKVADPLSKVNIGKMINWEITKGKAGCHEGISGEYLYNFKPPSINIVRDLIACCVEFGVIERRGAYYYLNDFKGYLKDLEAYIKKDINLIPALQATLVHEKGLHIRYV